MSRRTKTTMPAKEQEEVTTLSQSPVEQMPEEAGTMTGATAAVAPKVPEHKGPAKAVAEPVAGPVKQVKYYRVLNDRSITGSTGFRARIRAGKEFNDTQYNPARLKAQGVQLVEIGEAERIG